VWFFVTQVVLQKKSGENQVEKSFFVLYTEQKIAIFILSIK